MSKANSHFIEVQNANTHEDGDADVFPITSNAHLAADIKARGFGNNLA